MVERSAGRRHSAFTEEFIEILARAATMTDERRTDPVSPERADAEREVRIGIDEHLNAHPCTCPCDELPMICECVRCLHWMENRIQLQSLGVYLDGVREATSFRELTSWNVQDLADEIQRLLTEGERGHNFLVVSRGDAFVQCIQFLEPERDRWLTVEVTDDESVFAASGEAFLSALGFARPSETEAKPARSGHDGLISTAAEDEHPLYWQRVDISSDVNRTAAQLGELFAAVLQQVFGATPADPIIVELHLEAGT